MKRHERWTLASNSKRETAVHVNTKAAQKACSQKKNKRKRRTQTKRKEQNARKIRILFERPTSNTVNSELEFLNRWTAQPNSK